MLGVRATRCACHCWGLGAAGAERQTAVPDETGLSRRVARGCSVQVGGTGYNVATALVRQIVMVQTGAQQALMSQGGRTRSPPFPGRLSSPEMVGVPIVARHASQATNQRCRRVIARHWAGLVPQRGIAAALPRGPELRLWRSGRDPQVTEWAAGGCRPPTKRQESAGSPDRTRQWQWHPPGGRWSEIESGAEHRRQARLGYRWLDQRATQIWEGQGSNP